MAAAVLFVLYCITSITEFTLGSYILAPLCYLAAGGISLFSFFRVDRTKTTPLIFLLFAIACFSWMTAEIRWAFIDWQGYEPLQDKMASAFYLFANIAIFLAVVVYVSKRIVKWNKVQLLFDTMAIMIANGLFIWSMFFNRDQALLLSFFKTDIFAFISTVFDLLIISLLLLWLFSVRSGKMPVNAKLALIGVMIFVSADIIFNYSYFHNTYSPDSWIDILYVISMFFLAFSALMRHYDIDNVENRLSMSNIGFRRKSLLLLVYPIISMLFTGFNLPDILIFTVIILLYDIVSSNIQTLIKNKELLKKQVEANEELNKRLNDRDTELATLSELDILTKIPNRRYFLDVLDIMLRGRQANQIVTLFYINIDRFKTINDIYGYDIGDRVLVEFSARLKGHIEEGAVLARQGGDEFTVLSCGDYNRSQLESQARHLIHFCSEPIQLEEHRIHLTISVGISSCPVDTTEAITLMKYADIAMNRAKSQGYNRYAFFDVNYNESLRRKHDIELLLREASIENDFELFYQPQFDLSGKDMVGAEALIRWKDKGQGYISPGDFIPVAEEAGYITKIGAWVMKEAFTQAVEWNTRYGLELKIGINISPIQLNDDEFIKTLKQYINESKIKTMWLDVEITENVMLSNEPQDNEVFELFRQLGITVSIDDFGTGYSTLNYLKKYPFNRIKIDKSLIDNIATNQSDREIVKVIISMADAMNIKTIAEGVENKTQLAALQTLGCTQVQGYLLGKPVSANKFEENYIKKLCVPAR